jgi:hypothetical protein
MLKKFETKVTTGTLEDLKPQNEKDSKNTKILSSNSLLNLDEK